MPAFTGRGVTVELDGSTVMCFRTVSMSHGDASIDVGDSCSDGFREVMEEGDQQQIDLTVDGVAKTTWLRNLLLGGGNRILEGVTITWPVHGGGTTGATLVGDFRLTGYTEDFTYNDVTTFSVTLESTGPWVFTDEV